MDQKYSSFRGAMLGMAVGDAMGYTVDRHTLEQICQDYGPNGLLGYDLVNGCAEVTSYTQLAAYCANGLLLGLTRGPLQRKDVPLVGYVGVALKEWARQQQYGEPEKSYCWLSTQPQFKRRRCMDPRLLDALSRELGTPQKPQCRSDHPSALMTVIPVALMAHHWQYSMPEVMALGERTVALTHGQPEAFLTGAALAHLLVSLLKDPTEQMPALLERTCCALEEQYGSQYHQATELSELLRFAQTLATSNRLTGMETMERLCCRNAPQVLAGAAYACCICEADFDAALITAVNHSGRSAAVGALTGAILGIRLGKEALPEFYLECLEPAALLEELADDLVQAGPAAVGNVMFDDEWDRKYFRAGLY